MMQTKHFIGIDISKGTLDISVVTEGTAVHYQRINNTVKEIKKAIAQILRQLRADYEDVVFCMEHTGIYNLPIVQWLHSNQAKIWLESGVHIRKSLGLMRGKNDKVDSSRIAMYAFSHRHLIRLWKMPRVVLQKIAALLSQRTRLIKVKKQLCTTYEELSLFLNADIVKCISKYNFPTIAMIEKQIESIEKEIMQLIQQDATLNNLYKLITSVEGIGFVTACYVLITTNEFLSIREAKKYACYCGVVPFEHSSGSSVRGRTRVSHMANKTLKTLFHTAAMSTIRMKGEMKDYYQRKISEGKNKMSILNAVRNKLILRIFACVNQNRSFEKVYQYSFG